ncbi:MAG TPA: hypothetical protein VGN26_04745 [Armatimonadota bacterium]|jgi:hypothetical protein
MSSRRQSGRRAKECSPQPASIAEAIAAIRSGALPGSTELERQALSDSEAGPLALQLSRALESRRGSPVLPPSVELPLLP